MVVQIYQILFTGLFYMEFVHWQDRMGGGVFVRFTIEGKVTTLNGRLYSDCKPLKYFTTCIFIYSTKTYLVFSFILSFWATYQAWACVALQHKMVSKFNLTRICFISLITLASGESKCHVRTELREMWVIWGTTGKTVGKINQRGRCLDVQRHCICFLSAVLSM